MVKNVIVVNDYPYINGGAGKVAIMSAISLAREKINVYYFCGTGEVCDELKKSNVKIITTGQKDIISKNKLYGFFQGLRNKKAEKVLEDLILKIGCDNTIIHFHAWSKILSSSIFRVPKKYKIPVVVTGHDYGTVCPNGCFFDFRKNEICMDKPLSLKCMCKNCDKKNYIYKLFRIIRQFINKRYIKGNCLHYFYISNFSEKIIKNNLFTKAERHFVVNPIDVKFLKRADVKNNDYFLYVGRVSQEKGVDMFCRAISELNLRGLVVGDGPILEELKDKYPDISFVGWKKSDEIVNYAVKAKALVFPSIWYECAPLTIPEVMGKYYLPAIVSDLCAGKDYIINGKNGYIYDGNNLDDLKDKIKKMNENCEEFQSYIKDKFNRNLYLENVHSKNLIDEYNKILSK